MTILNSKNISDCEKLLQEVWKFGSEQWNKTYPQNPINPILTQTYRSNAIQNCYYNQGRISLDLLNKERKKLKLYLLKESENKVITRLKGGASKHNKYPSQAFDISFFASDTKKLNWEEKNFKLFADIILEKYSDKITWGGSWKNFKDSPHFEIK